MPLLSRVLIRASLVYLVLGFTVGAWILAAKAQGGHAFQWLPAHIEFLLTGFVIQLTLGVAFWMFPRLLTLTDRGRERPLWIATAGLNIGIVICCLPALGLEWIGRSLELGSILLFTVNLWPRIYAFGRF